jgi:hypothetical protein
MKDNKRLAWPAFSQQRYINSIKGLWNPRHTERCLAQSPHFDTPVWANTNIAKGDLVDQDQPFLAVPPQGGQDKRQS